MVSYAKILTILLRQVIVKDPGRRGSNARSK